MLALYDAHKNMVYRLALSYLKSVPDAEDAVQQVFLKLLEHRDAVAPGKERSWLAAVTANLCRDMLRAAARRQAEPLPADMPAAPPGDSGLYEAVTALRSGPRCISTTTRAMTHGRPPVSWAYPRPPSPPG